jgi:PIN domain nuclease of toxin-antitoxin system
MLLDTCGLVWYTLDPEKLSNVTLKKLNKSSRLYVSAISIAELGIKIKKKQLKIPVSLREFVQRLGQTTITVLPVTEWTILDSMELKWTHTDPADRIIVATAKTEKWPIVTRDDAIRKFYSKTLS